MQAERIMGFVRKSMKKPLAALVAAMIGGVVLASGAAALNARSAADRFANATFERLGGDPEVVLGKIADSVVDRLTSGKGIGDAQAALMDRLGDVAGDKLANIDAESLLKDMQGKVMAAGLGKLDDIDTDAVMAHVTGVLVEKALAELEAIDLEAIAKSVLSDVVSDVDLEKLVAEALANIDVEKLIGDAVKKQMSVGGLLGGLLGR
jgi:hypothetical protein